MMGRDRETANERCCWLKKCSSRSLKKRGIAELLFAQLTAQYILIKIKSNNCLCGKVDVLTLPQRHLPPSHHHLLKVVFVRLNCYVCSGVCSAKMRWFIIEHWNIEIDAGWKRKKKLIFLAHKHKSVSIQMSKNAAAEREGNNKINIPIHCERRDCSTSISASSYTLI